MHTRVMPSMSQQMPEATAWRKVSRISQRIVNSAVEGFMVNTQGGAPSRVAREA
jgi:hypothetical protein